MSWILVLQLALLITLTVLLISAGVDAAIKTWKGRQ